LTLKYCSKNRKLLQSVHSADLRAKFRYYIVLGHDVTTFSNWENILYDFSETTGGGLQPPDIFITSGTFRELPTPTITSYDPISHSITWENNYEAGDINNIRVRIWGSLDVDDILFDSENLAYSSNSYTFTDSVAIDLLDAGVIFGVEARKFKSTSEIENTSIYITQSEPVDKEVLYDDFSSLEFNSSGQWRIVEGGNVDNFSLTHNNGRLRVSLTSDSIDKTKISLRLPHQTKLRKSIRALVTLISADSRSSIELRGELLNVKRAPSYAYSLDGNVFVKIFIENQHGLYRAGMEASITDSNGIPESELIPWEIVDTNIQLGVQYPMSISFDAATKTITLMVGTTQRQYSFDSSVDIFPLSSCQSAGLRIGIYTRQDEGVKTIIGEVDDVFVSEDYDPALWPCPKPPNSAPLFLLLTD